MPITGKQIAVTRPADQGNSVASRLKRLGAVPVLCPLIKITPCFDPAELRDCFSGLEKFDWIFFTSANGVQLSLEFAKKKKLLNAFDGLQIACIGPATANALAAWGLSPTFIPDVYQAEGLLEAFKKTGVKNQKILLLRAKEARQILRQGLVDLGTEVAEVAIYETSPDPEGVNLLTLYLQEKNLDCITFTSGSTVQSFIKILKQFKNLPPDMERISFASIGAITSDELRRHGLPVHIQANVSTAEGLVNAISQYFETN